MLTIAIPKGGLLPEAIALLQTIGLDFSAFLDKKNRQLQITDPTGTVAGVAVCAVLLSVPPPDTIDQAPVVALPPTLAPDNVIAEGLADWQTRSGPPASTEGAGSTVMVLVSLTAEQLPGASVVNVNVTVPEKLAAGV